VLRRACRNIPDGEMNVDGCSGESDGSDRDKNESEQLQ
jgi:hypothetical protein